ncbi:MAG: T9SS type A sorting domain-containing protein [Candidatus Latescibacteria bacterium]|nr:T9SS type A sorting domain-containing protein [Candidatus Latescibacterota bacterium]
MVITALLLGLTTAIAAQTRFEDISHRSGIGQIGRGSVSWIDFNNDGVLDLYFGIAADSTPGRLLVQKANRRFIDLTHTAYSEGPEGYSIGIADYDGDGAPDFFSTNYAAPPALMRNHGSVFAEATQAAGITLPGSSSERFSTGVSFVDYDNDGHLDLFVGNENGRDVLYRNQGDATFADRTQEAGLARPAGTRYHMFADYDGDGDMDLFVGTSDNPDVPEAYRDVPDALYNNQGDATFVDISLAAGIAHPPQRSEEVAFFDYDNDGDLDLAIAGGAGSTDNLLYRNEGDGTFTEVARQAGLVRHGDATDLTVGDFDNDGWLDLFVGNLISDQPSFLFYNQQDGTFAEAAGASGLALPGTTLHASAADYDNDGFLDLAVVNLQHPEALLRNRGNARHWLHLHLVGTQSNRSAIGARVRVVAGDLVMLRQVNGGGGYDSPPPSLHFGLGRQRLVDSLEIRWPSGLFTRLEALEADQHLRIIEGSQGHSIVEPNRWLVPPPDTVVAGRTVHLDFSLQPALYDAESAVVAVQADLGDFAAGQALLRGGNPYRLQADVQVDETPGVKVIPVTIDQQTAIGPHRTRLLWPVVALPATDLVLLGPQSAPDWQFTARLGLQLDLDRDCLVFAGRDALALAATGTWQLTLRPPAPYNPFGLATLNFAFHPGSISAGALDIWVDQIRYPIALPNGVGAGIDLGLSTWQEVELPLPESSDIGQIDLIRFGGNSKGTAYIADIRLARVASPATTTRVAVAPTGPLAPSLGLEQNYPNPFNSATAIRFVLPERQDIELSIYNLAGQKVATLTEGIHPKGPHLITWSGRDDEGRALAAGVYLYRLRTSKAQEETRKLVLAR